MTRAPAFHWIQPLHHQTSTLHHQTSTLYCSQQSYNINILQDIMRVFYLGTQQQYQVMKSCHPHRTTIMLDGTVIFIADHSSSTEQLAWLAEYNSIKNDIEYMLNRHRHGRLRIKHLKRHLRNSWIPRVKHFIKLYGKYYVPNDLRIAYDNTASNLGLQQMEDWPDLYQITD